MRILSSPVGIPSRGAYEARLARVRAALSADNDGVLPKGIPTGLRKKSRRDFVRGIGSGKRAYLLADLRRTLRLQE